MAKKKKARSAALAPAPAATPKKERRFVANVLLDWRFNLAILVCMELLLIAIFFNRELVRFHQERASRALQVAESREDYERAYKDYKWLLSRDKNAPSYIQRLGDAALGLENYTEALDLYKKASGGRFDRPGMNLSMALCYRGMAGKTNDPKRQTEYLRSSIQHMNRAVAEAPLDLKTNYWRGQLANSMGDLVEASEYFARVRSELIRRPRPANLEEKRLEADAKEQIEAIRAYMLGDADYALHVDRVKFPERMPVVRPGAAVTPPPATSPTLQVEPEGATTPSAKVETTPTK